MPSGHSAPNNTHSNTHPQQQVLPENWPITVTFSTKNIWAKSVPDSLKTTYCPPTTTTTPSGTLAPPKSSPEVADVHSESVIPYDGPSPLVTIRKIDSDDHPAKGQLGLFANQRIPAFSHILDYIGEVHLDETLPPQNDYALFLHGPLTISAQDIGNEARCINDFRGISSRPSAAFDTYRDALTGEVRIGCWTLNRALEVGEEILVTYGKAWWKARGVKVEGPEWDEEWDIVGEEEGREEE
ncbi:hypothetical protein HDV00_006740 [Rhizophlyctis rosea]|nr:hypothetical protein HDV00_006740 [Rhizophlyctis rosea]